jgi:hypothetical protein
MNTGQSILATGLFVCWAMLLGARAIAATIYSNRPGSSYAYGVKEIGWVVPTFGWICFAAGLLVVALIIKAEVERKKGSDC